MVLSGYPLLRSIRTTKIWRPTIRNTQTVLNRSSFNREKAADPREPSARIPIRREGHLGPLTIFLETIDVTAVKGIDYRGTKGNVKFDGNEIELTVSIRLFPNKGSSEPKKFLVKISSPSRGIVVDGKDVATVHINVGSTSEIQENLNFGGSISFTSDRSRTSATGDLQISGLSPGVSSSNIPPILPNLPPASLPPSGGIPVPGLPPPNLPALPPPNLPALPPQIYQHCHLQIYQQITFGGSSLQGLPNPTSEGLSPPGPIPQQGKHRKVCRTTCSICIETDSYVFGASCWPFIPRKSLESMLTRVNQDHTAGGVEVLCYLAGCPPGTIFHQCSPTCPQVCNVQPDAGACSKRCITGCFCPDGMIFESLTSHRCILPSQCPGGNRQSVVGRGLLGGGGGGGGLLGGGGGGGGGLLGGGGGGGGGLIGGGGGGGGGGLLGGLLGGGGGGGGGRTPRWRGRRRRDFLAVSWDEETEVFNRL
ncbi:hypothetical protein CEXT_712581 [Caerostris extrusa]|uniref:TIL domain-containing protein n=1 Tax=Caerostris extrusa TaxID=172846 RepID=A0AAV4XCS6_CAEEX|nr:hypothetical protein CEXT_712581 [Caerostris extrusa]